MRCVSPARCQTSPDTGILAAAMEILATLPVLLTSALYAATAAPVVEEDPSAPTAPMAPTSMAPVPASKASGQGDGEDPVLRALAPVPGGLTANGVARAAVDAGPTVDEANAQLEAARAQLDEVRKSFTPALSLEASAARLSKVQAGIPLDDMTMALVGDEFSFDIPLNQYALTARLGLPVSDWILQLLPGLKAGEAGSRGAELRRDAERRVVATDARIAFYGWLRAKAQVAVAEASLARSQARLRDAQAGVRAGMMSPGDELRVDALVARTEAALEAARAAERVSRRALAILTALPLESNFEVGEAVMGTSAAEATEDLDTLVSRGLARRPELLAVDAAVDEVEASTRARRAAYFPRVSAFGEATYANPNQRFFPLSDEWNGSWAVGASLVWSLEAAVVATARVDALKASRVRVDAQREQLRRAVTLEVVQAFEAVARTEASLVANERAKTSAAEAYRVVSVRFANGTATTTDVINAEFDRVDASLALVNTHLDLLEARARLDFATGAPVLAAGVDGDEPG